MSQYEKPARYWLNNYISPLTFIFFQSLCCSVLYCCCRIHSFIQTSNTRWVQYYSVFLTGFIEDRERTHNSDAATFVTSHISDFHSYSLDGFLPHYYSANRVEWSVSVLKWLPHTLLCLVFSGGLAGKKNLELILIYIIFNFMMIEVKFSSARPKTAVSVIIWVRRSRCLLHFLGLLGQRL